MNNDNLPPVINQNETTPFFKNKKNLIVLGIIIVIIIVNTVAQIKDTINDKKGIRAYDIVDGNIFVITYKLSDGLIDHLEIANGLTKKPMNVQSLPGYPLLTKEQVDALPEDWEPYL